MSKFYGTVIGSGKTPATRRGFTSIATAAQSFDGSVITELKYKDGDLIVTIEIADGSATSGYRYFTGTMDEFKNVLRGVNK